MNFHHTCTNTHSKTSSYILIFSSSTFCPPNRLKNWQKFYWGKNFIGKFDVMARNFQKGKYFSYRMSWHRLVIRF